MFPHECTGQLAFFWANLTPLSPQISYHSQALTKSPFRGLFVNNGYAKRGCEAISLQAALLYIFVPYKETRFVLEVARAGVAPFPPSRNFDQNHSFFISDKNMHHPLINV